MGLREACQADRAVSGVVTVSETKELQRRYGVSYGGTGAERERIVNRFRQFWKQCDPCERLSFQRLCFPLEREGRGRKWHLALSTCVLSEWMLLGK